MRTATRPILVASLVAATGVATGPAAGGGAFPDVPGATAHDAATFLRVGGEGTKPAVPVAGTRTDKQAPEAGQCTASEEVFAAIAAERALLDMQRAEIAERRAALDLAREQLEAEAAQLAEVRDRVAALLERAEAEQSQDVQRLVNLYRNMKPEEAAAIMDDLDLEVTFTVLAGMSERDAGPILAELDPVLARALSRILLERSQLPADQTLSNLRLP
jgi:flagellar motility protein MotE (MotC chaperone)